MLTINTQITQEEINAFLEEQSVPALPDNAIVMAAKIKDELLAIGALTMENYKICLNHIIVKDAAKEDKLLPHGLAKSLLNLADLRGMKTIYGTNSALTNLYKGLRFTEENGTFMLSLEGYFTTGHCE